MDEINLEDANYPFNMDQQKWNDANKKCREEYLSSMILIVVTAAESNLFHGTLVVFPPTRGTYTTQCIDSPVPSTGTKMFEG